MVLFGLTWSLGFVPVAWMESAVARWLIALAFAVPVWFLAAVCWGARITVLNGWEHFALPLKAAALLATIALAGAAFFGTATLLRVEEMTEITALVKRKIGRRKAA